MTELEELQMETQTLYDDYLYQTENRGISYGEIAYIQGLARQGLDEFCEELDNAMREGAK